MATAAHAPTRTERTERTERAERAGARTERAVAGSAREEGADAVLPGAAPASHSQAGVTSDARGAPGAHEALDMREVRDAREERDAREALDAREEFGASREPDTDKAPDAAAGARTPAGTSPPSLALLRDPPITRHAAGGTSPWGLPSSQAATPPFPRAPVHTPALRQLAPPEPADVRTEDGIPRTIRWRQQVIAVTRAIGPERLAGDWWDAAYARDYWRCEDAAGTGDLVLYRDCTASPPAWYVHAWYD